MRALPLDIGAIHFIGVGGIGMSGVAEVLHTLGYAVTGSDIAENANVKRLRALGVNITVGHAAENVGAAAAAVISTAVKPDNPEVREARARLIPIVRRAEMLAELMRLKWSIAVGGTHGKTTTTSLIAHMLDAAGFDPTIINGGIINAIGSNARLGAGDWLVAEADESDGSFLKLPATIAVVTNIDPEHLDHYGDFDALRAAFDSFVANIPFYGFAALCADHAEVQAMIPRVSDRRIVTYGFSPQADARAVNVTSGPDGGEFDVVFSDRRLGRETRIEGLRLPMHGLHNVQNALAAAAIGREMGIPDETLRRAMAGFEGVKRRFTKTGETDGVTVIDDYAHHPVEISAVLQAARTAAGEGRVIAVVQPHRYTRLRDLFEDFCSCFNDADAVIVAPVYEAGEAPIEDFNSDALAQGLRERGHRSVLTIEDGDGLAAAAGPLCKPGDFIVCLGAGSITQWANALPGRLAGHLAGQGDSA
ncbi:MAG: UDP-N-acetylmuramate--L-alanine ligase [Rhodospirillales bacterium]